ncbi:hypothetical protein BJ165DRAFT_1526232 [Panaeolus papilionaceus]|nr:hypothetical protein BJ165DRAFT_1526232 [Panaeolus papilionaceus]
MSNFTTSTLRVYTAFDVSEFRLIENSRVLYSQSWEDSPHLFVANVRVLPRFQVVVYFRHCATIREGQYREGFPSTLPSHSTGTEPSQDHILNVKIFEEILDNPRTPEEKHTPAYDDEELH